MSHSKDKRIARREARKNGGAAIVPPPAPEQNRRPPTNYAYRPELDEAIRKHFAVEPWRKGAGVKFYAVIKYAKPELLTDLNGRSLSERLVSGHCNTIITRDRAIREAAARLDGQPVPQPGMRLHSQLDEAAVLALKITSTINDLALVGNVSTLTAIADLIEGGI